MSVRARGEVAMSDKVARESPHLGGYIRLKYLKEEGERAMCINEGKHFI